MAHHQLCLPSALSYRLMLLSSHLGCARSPHALFTRCTLPRVGAEVAVALSACVERQELLSLCTRLQMVENAQDAVDDDLQKVEIIKEILYLAGEHHVPLDSAAATLLTSSCLLLPPLHATMPRARSNWALE